MPAGPGTSSGGPAGGDSGADTRRRRAEVARGDGDCEDRGNVPADPARPAPELDLAATSTSVWAHRWRAERVGGRAPQREDLDEEAAAGDSAPVVPPPSVGVNGEQ